MDDNLKCNILSDDELDGVTGGSNTGANCWQLFCSCCGVIKINASKRDDAFRQAAEHNDLMNHGGWGENHYHDACPIQM